MSEHSHLYHIESTWEGSSLGDGQIHAHGKDIAYGIPTQLGGAGGRTNPEEMLLASVAGCYSIVLADLAGRRRVPISRVELSAEGEVEKQPGGTYKYVAIRLSPRIHAAITDEAQLRTLEDLAHKAEQYCLISNAIRGSVRLELKVEIVTS